MSGPLEPTLNVIKRNDFEVTEKSHGYDINVPGKRGRLMGLEEPDTGQAKDMDIRWYGNSAHNDDFPVVADEVEELSKFDRLTGFSGANLDPDEVDGIEDAEDLDEVEVVAIQIEQILRANPPG